MDKYSIKVFCFLFIFSLSTSILQAQLTASLANISSVEKVMIFEDSKGHEVPISPYNLSFNKEFTLFSVGLGFQIAGIAVLNNLEPLSASDIATLSSNEVNNFDFKATKHYSSSAQTLSDIIFYSSFAFPLILASQKNIRDDYLKIGAMASEAFLLNAGLTTLTKVLVKRSRPFVYNPNVALETKQTKTARLSFFSGHTSTVSVLSFFSAKVYADYYPNSKWKPLVWSVAVALPALTAYSRYKAGKHFPSDVIVGYGVGAAIGILIPHLHRNKQKKKQFRISPMTNGDAVGMTLRGVF